MSMPSRAGCSSSIIMRLRMFFGWWMPGVSIRTIWASSRLRMPWMRLRVVCGLGETMATFWPTRVLTSVDLPALGRPTIATKPDLKGMDLRIVRLWGAARKVGGCRGATLRRRAKDLTQSEQSTAEGTEKAETSAGVQRKAEDKARSERLVGPREVDYGWINWRRTIRVARILAL